MVNVCQTFVLYFLYTAITDIGRGEVFLKGWFETFLWDVR